MVVPLITTAPNPVERFHHRMNPGTLSRLLNARAGVLACMAQALESVGRGNAEHRMRMPASYDLAQAPRNRKMIGRAPVAR